MFENLSERLERSFKILKGEGKITEVNISEAMKDIRRALLDADVSYKIAKQTLKWALSASSTCSSSRT